MAKRILNVDDDPMIRTLVKAMLEAEGYEICSMDSGPKALEWLDSLGDNINLAFIVLDYMMPEMTGIELLQKLKQNPKTANIPVMMVTGEDRTEDLLMGLGVGADLYITKPFTRNQLVNGTKLLQGIE